MDFLKWFGLLIKFAAALSLWHSEKKVDISTDFRGWHYFIIADVHANVLTIRRERMPR